jgi:hypothetical protein
MWPGTIYIREVDFEDNLDFKHNAIEINGPL